MDRGRAKTAAYIPELSRNTNDELTISRLPHELLGPIFAMASEIDKFRNSSLILPYTHVCQYWRNVAVSVPLLWRYIHFSCQHPKFSAECLVRSKGVPISVTDPEFPFDLLPKSSDLINVDRRRIFWEVHGPRIAELVMNMYSLRETVLPEDLFQNLAFLKVFYVPHNGPAIVLPPVKFPALRRLDLRRVSLKSISWDSISRLTHLSIIGLDFQTSPSFKQILGIISRSPLLQSITLADVELSNSTSLRAPFSLPELKTISLALTPSSTFGLITSLSIPPTAFLQLEQRDRCTLTPLLPNDFTRRFPHLDITSQSCLLITEWELSLSKSQNVAERMVIYRGETDTPGFLKSVSRVWDLSKLTTLDVGGSYTYTKTAWAEFFVNLPALSTLKLYPVPSTVSNIFLAALLPTPHVNPRNLVCPQLQSLWLADDIGGDIQRDNVMYWETGMSNWIRQRASFGGVLSELHFLECGIRPAYADALRYIVEVVKVESGL